MVKIHEHQHTINNPENMQEREIEYFSWEKYVKDILNNHQTTQDIQYLSIPRDTRINKVIESSNNKLIINFYDPFEEEELQHIATLIIERIKDNKYGVE